VVQVVVPGMVPTRPPAAARIKLKIPRGRLEFAKNAA